MMIMIMIITITRRILVGSLRSLKVRRDTFLFYPRVSVLHGKSKYEVAVARKKKEKKKKKKVIWWLLYTHTFVSDLFVGKYYDHRIF